MKKSVKLFSVVIVFLAAAVFSCSKDNIDIDVSSCKECVSTEVKDTTSGNSGSGEW